MCKNIVLNSSKSDKATVLTCLTDTQEVISLNLSQS